MTELGFTGLPVERVFSLFDQNGDGFIDYKELLTNLSTLRQSGTEALQLCFQIYDENNSGFITREQVAKVLVS